MHVMFREVFVGYNTATCFQSQGLHCASFILHALNHLREDKWNSYIPRSTMDASSGRKLRLEPHEKEYFYALMKENIDILSDRSTTTRSLIRKNECWEEITKKFNNVTGFKRRNSEIRKLWDNLRKA